MSDEKREFIVYTPDAETAQSILDDLTKSGSSSPESVPAREVEIADAREINPTSTNYFLTKEEARLLQQDPRVGEVLDIVEVKPFKRAFQTGSFPKTSGSTGNKGNWGLIRHIAATNVFGTFTADPGRTYDYVLDGTGVDVVILDSGIQPDHPEFLDDEGNTRVQQINWFTQSGVFGTQPNGFYADYEGHGTHVASVVAGKTFGWAKNAQIYSIKLTALAGPTDPFPGLNVNQAMDVLLGWHQSKDGSRPTVVVNAWGYSIFWDTTQDAFTFDPTGSGAYYSVNGGDYRGTLWTGAVKDTAKGHTGGDYDTNIYQFPYQSASLDSDIAILTAAGIMVVNAAGNDSTKADALGGSDYNNYITLEGLENFYYHRGGSPNVKTLPGFQVGALGTTTVGPANSTEFKAAYSNAGPGVNIYAAGSAIMGAMSDTNIYSGEQPYNPDSAYLQHSLNGTSFSAPQVAGLVALLLQVHPKWRPAEVVNWVIDQTKAVMYDSGLDDDFTASNSLWGGSNSLAYTPFGVRKTYGISTA
jgi:subtilisin family serine protease